MFHSFYLGRTTSKFFFSDAGDLPNIAPSRFNLGIDLISQKYVCIKCAHQAPVAQSVSARYLYDSNLQSDAEVVSSSLTWSRTTFNMVVEKKSSAKNRDCCPTVHNAQPTKSNRSYRPECINNKESTTIGFGLHLAADLIKVEV